MKRKTSEFSLHSMVVTCFRVIPKAILHTLLCIILGCYSFIKNSRDKFVIVFPADFKKQPQISQLYKRIGLKRE